MKVGETTKENGAIVSALGQFYIHSLPRNQEEIINDMIRDYKKCKVELVDELETGIEIAFTDLQVYEQKKEKKEKYDRAKKKDQDRKDIERGFEEWEK